MIGGIVLQEFVPICVMFKFIELHIDKSDRGRPSGEFSHPQDHAHTAHDSQARELSGVIDPAARLTTDAYPR